MQDQTQTVSAKPGLMDILRAGLIGLVSAVVINAVLYLVGAMFTFPEDALSQIGEPVTLGPVIVITAGAGVVAIVGYFVLNLFLSKMWVRRVMWAVAVVVLIGMTITPFTISNVDTAQIVILEIMHIIAAAPVYFLTRL